MAPRILLLLYDYCFTPLNQDWPCDWLWWIKSRNDFLGLLIAYLRSTDSLCFLTHGILLLETSLPCYKEAQASTMESSMCRRSKASDSYSSAPSWWSTPIVIHVIQTLKISQPPQHPINTIERLPQNPEK